MAARSHTTARFAAEVQSVFSRYLMNAWLGKAPTIEASFHAGGMNPSMAKVTSGLRRQRLRVRIPSGTPIIPQN